MSGAHTPGPWLHESDGDWRDICKSGRANMHVIAQITCSVGESGEETDRANARLIAAAPDQHDAHVKINEIANRVFQMGDAECRRALQEVYEISRAAIAKATGQ